MTGGTMHGMSGGTMHGMSGGTMHGMSGGTMHGMSGGTIHGVTGGYGGLPPGGPGARVSGGPGARVPGGPYGRVASGPVNRMSGGPGERVSGGRVPGGPGGRTTGGGADFAPGNAGSAASAGPAGPGGPGLSGMPDLPGIPGIPGIPGFPGLSGFPAGAGTGRFPPPVAAALADAGWRPGRWDIKQAERWADELRAYVSPGGHRHAVFPAAVEAWAEFGGLSVPAAAGPGRGVAPSAVVVDPLRGLHMARTMGDLGRALETLVAPLGEEGGTGALLALDAEGRVYTVDHTGDWYAGPDIDSALSALVGGVPPVRLTRG